MLEWSPSLSPRMPICLYLVIKQESINYSIYNKQLIFSYLNTQRSQISIIIRNLYIPSILWGKLEKSWNFFTTEKCEPLVQYDICGPSVAQVILINCNVLCCASSSLTTWTTWFLSDGFIVTVSWVGGHCLGYCVEMLEERQNRCYWWFYCYSELGGRTLFRLLCRDAGGEIEQMLLKVLYDGFIVTVSWEGGHCLGYCVEMLEEKLNRCY